MTECANSTKRRIFSIGIYLKRQRNTFLPRRSHEFLCFRVKAPTPPPPPPATCASNCIYAPFLSLSQAVEKTAKAQEGSGLISSYSLIQ